MPTQQYSYELDTTGALSVNKITEEFHTVTAVNDRNYNFIIPKFGPYLVSSMKAFKVVGQTRTPLTKNVDWHPSLEFQGATFATAKQWYGALSFLNLGFSGTIVLEYQTLGGEYTLDEQQMAEVIANIVYNPRAITWEEITGLPKMFPPIDHPWNFADMVGQTEVVAAIDRIAQVLLNRNNASLEDHLRDFLNPHKVTKNQVQLGNVENFGPAGTTTAIQGVSNNTLITPMTLRAVLDALGLLDLSELLTLIREHLSNQSNPHHVDKFQVELGNVENLQVATPSDIVAKRRVRRYVTLDLLIDYMALHGCAPRGDQEPDYPPKDALLATHCSNSNNMGVYANGQGGTYEKIIEVNSRDCGYVPPPASPAHPPLGTVLNKYCIMFEQYGTYADGYGGSYTRLIKMNSEDCGYSGPNPPPGGNPPAGTILSTRCEGKTLVKVIANGNGGSYDERVPNSPQCNEPPTNPPADQLVDTKCVGTDLKGRYTDGNGGYYEAIIERNSSECGYTPPTTPNPPGPNPTTAPSVAFAALSTSKPVVAYGTDYTLSIAGSGFPPNTQVTVNLFGNKATGLSYVKNNWYIGTTNAQGELNFSSTMINNGDDGVGNNTRYAVIQYGSQNYRATQIDFQLLGQTSITRPTIALSADAGVISVGNTTNLRASLSTLEVGQSYTVTWNRKHYNEATFTQWGNTSQFTADASTKLLSLPVTNVGDSLQGISNFTATIVHDANPTLKATSSNANIQFTANRTASLVINNSVGPIDIVIGDTPLLRWDARDMPISGLSPNNPNLIGYWESDEGGVQRRAGPYTSQTDSQGRAGGVGPEAIFGPALNSGRAGVTRYRGVLNWVSVGGTQEVVNSNWVTINWKSPQVTPPPPPPVTPPSANRTLTFGVSPSTLTPGTYYTMSIGANGFPANTSVLMQLWQRFNGNLTMVTEYPVQTNASGFGTATVGFTDPGPGTIARGTYEFFLRAPNYGNQESNHVFTTYAGGATPPSAQITIYVDAQPVPNGAYPLGALVSLNATFDGIPIGEQFTIEYWAHNRATLAQVRIGQNTGIGQGSGTGTASLLYYHSSGVLPAGAYDLFCKIPSKGVTSNGITTRAFA